MDHSHVNNRISRRLPRDTGTVPADTAPPWEMCLGDCPLCHDVQSFDKEISRIRIWNGYEYLYRSNRSWFSNWGHVKYLGAIPQYRKAHIAGRGEEDHINPIAGRLIWHLIPDSYATVNAVIAVALRAGQLLAAFCPDHNRAALSAFPPFFYKRNICALLFVKYGNTC